MYRYKTIDWTNLRAESKPLSVEKDCLVANVRVPNAIPYGFGLSNAGLAKAYVLIHAIHVKYPTSNSDD